MSIDFDPGIVFEQPADLAPKARAGQTVQDVFFDARDAYGRFVRTTKEKFVIAERLAKKVRETVLPEGSKVFRLFDAGVGYGHILDATLKAAAAHFGPDTAHYVVGKEISFEDVEQALTKAVERIAAHPKTVITLTNLPFTQAPWLLGQDVEFLRIPLKGSTPEELSAEIEKHRAQLESAWETTVENGKLKSKHRVVASFYRADQEDALADILPKPGETTADYNLIVASQPYRLANERKAEQVLAPLARALAVNGTLVGIQASDRGNLHEITRTLWKDDFFYGGAESTLAAAKAELVDPRSAFAFEMGKPLHCTLEPTSSASAVLDAWNAAVYVAQVDGKRVEDAVGTHVHVKAAQGVVAKQGEIWFENSEFNITRKARHSVSDEDLPVSALNPEAEARLQRAVGTGRLEIILPGTNGSKPPKRQIRIALSPAGKKGQYMLHTDSPNAPGLFDLLCRQGLIHDTRARDAGLSARVRPALNGAGEPRV